MKILFISTFYEQKANSAAIRNNAWVEGLCSLGHDVTVETVEWPEALKSDFLVKNNQANVRRTFLKELNILKTTSKTISSKRAGQFDWFRHLIRDIIFFPDICKNWSKKFKNTATFDYDLILSSSDFKSSHFMGMRLKNEHPEVPWIQIWGDPWGSDISLSWLTRKRACKNEKRLLQAADAVVYVSSLTRDYIERLYPELGDKLHYIPRGYFKKVKRQPNNQKGYISLLYTGSLNYSGRNIEPLLETLYKYNNTVEIPIQLDVYGTIKASLLEEIESHDFVKFHKSVDYEQVLSLYSSADILLFISNSATSTQIPGKLFDYLGTELPILCLLEDKNSHLQKILSVYERCKIAENNVQEISRLLSCIDDWTSEKYMVDENLSPQSIASDLVRIAEQI